MATAYGITYPFSSLTPFSFNLLNCPHYVAFMAITEVRHVA
jgi:hypothetical protein